MLLNPFVLGAGGGGGPPSSSTWNAADKDADVALSSGDTIASVTATAQGAVRGSQGRDASGDHYFEVTIGGTADGRMMVGIGLSSASLASYPGADGDGRGYWGSSGQKYASASGSSYGATFSSGDVIGVRLNAGALTFYVNGSSQGSAFTGLSGAWYPMCGTDTSVAGTRSATINTNPTPPSGSTAWG